jgi:thimet oligopeptidase
MKSVLSLALAVSVLAGSTPGARAAAEPSSGSAFAPTIINWSLTSPEIKSSCAAEIAKARSAANALASRPAPWTFANTTLALENISADLNDELVAQTFLSQVSPDAKIRATSLDCSNDVAAFGTDLTAIPSIYHHLVAADKSAGRWSDADKALSTLWIQQFSRSGAGLKPAERAEFVRLSKELNDLQLHFNQNVANDKSTIAITKAQSAGLPADLLPLFKTTDTGYTVPVNDSTYGPFMDNATDPSARKLYYFAFGNIGAPANVALLERAIAIRDRLAHLMGFPTWAAYQLDVRVDRSPAHIQKFLSDLDTELLPRARENLAEYAALKAKTTGDPQAKLDPWDIAFYINQLNKTKYAVDQEEIKQYFPAAHTVDAILGIYQHLLGVRFTAVKDVNGWQPDVTEYAVTDTASGKFLGVFLLDLYAREGKPGGAFNAPILPVRRLANGQSRAPISTIIVSEWPAATAGKPVLLTHEDVTTFFHEFGHNMAALLTTVPYESLTQFQQDFVEAPSQMLENFTWDPHVLQQISSNVTTGKPLPDDLIQKMIAARCATDRLCNAYAAVRQLLYSIVDMDYHMDGAHVDTTAVFAKVASETTPTGWTPGTHPQAAFTHLMGGYDAGYYTYLWSLVYAQDMFTAFQKGGLDNPEVGMRYRTTILAPGRMYDPNVEVKNFLGRPMSPDAFYNGFKNAH